MKRVFQKKGWRSLRLNTQKGIGLFSFISKKVNQKWSFTKKIYFDGGELRCDYLLKKDDEVIKLDGYINRLTIEQMKKLEKLQQI